MIITWAENLILFLSFCPSMFLSSLVFVFTHYSFCFSLLCGVPVWIVFRYFFPPLDSPWAGSRWSSYAQLLPPQPPPPPPLPPLIEHSCDADTANIQYPHPRRRYISRPLKLLREHEGVWCIFKAVLKPNSHALKNLFLLAVLFLYIYIFQP